MHKLTVSAAIFATVFLGLTASARADISVQPTFDASNQAALPDTTDYEGNFFDDATAPYNITIGTFNFTIPTGFAVTGATISGMFGDQNIPCCSALTDFFVQSGTIKVAGCDSFSDPCATGTLDGSTVPWSYTFSPTDLIDLNSDFASGSLDFTAVQNSFGAVVVGTPTLDIQVAVTPEPAYILPLAGGLLAIAALRRRRQGSLNSVENQENE
ncbi:MAG TPA: hypothetical protein VGL82_22950 [Bryobacteraceae bacterium]|jgi:hypothetical protein